jgi:hypothetical protein
MKGALKAFPHGNACEPLFLGLAHRKNRRLFPSIGPRHRASVDDAADGVSETLVGRKGNPQFSKYPKEVSAHAIPKFL